MEKKRILFLGRFAPPMHGAAKMNELYFSYLEKSFDVKRIKINYSSSIKSIGAFDFSKVFGVFAVFFELLGELFRFKPDLVYFEIPPRGFAFFRDSLFVLVCKMFRKRIVFSIHARGVSKGARGKLKGWYYRFVFGGSKMILLSESLYPDVKDIFSTEDVYFLPNGIENEVSDKEFTGSLVRGNKKIRFLFLSNMIESKGPMEVLEFCSRLKKKGVDFECSFVGSFSDDEFEAKWKEGLKRMGLLKFCRYLGPKYGEEKKKLLLGSDFLIFPTVYPMECYPLVILEAFMCGVPVLTYDTGAIRDIVKEDYLGRVSLGRNIDELFGLFLDISKKKIERKKIREYFKKNYLVGKSGEKLRGILGKELAS